MGKTERLRLGLVGAGGTLEADDQFFKYQHPYGKSFRVPRKQVETVTLDMGKGFGAKAVLKLVGRGTELAQVELPKGPAEKAQTWLLERLTAV